MSEPVIRFKEARAESGASPRLLLTFAIQNPGDAALNVIDAHGSLWLLQEPHPEPIFAKTAYVSELCLDSRRSVLYPIDPGSTRTWTLGARLDGPALRFTERLRCRRGGDVHLQAVIEVLLDRGADLIPRFQWARVADQENSSRSYAPVRIPESDWLKLLQDLRQPQPLSGRVFGRLLLPGMISVARRKLWALLRKAIGWGTGSPGSG